MARSGLEPAVQVVSCKPRPANMPKRCRWIVPVLSWVAILACYFALVGSGGNARSSRMAQDLLQSWQSAIPPVRPCSMWSVEAPREMPGYMLTLSKPVSGFGIAMYQKRESWHVFYQEHVLALRQRESNVWQLSGSRL